MSLNSKLLCSISNFHSILNFSKTANAFTKISLCKKELCEVLMKLNQLREKVNQLNISEREMDETSWISEIIEIKKMQVEITNCMMKYKDKLVLKKLNQLLVIRKKKRISQSKRKELLKIAKQKTLENRKILHLQTSEWLRREHKEVLTKKRLAEAADKSEVVLFAVNKKISEAQNYIHLLDVLEKLRTCRSNISSKNDYTERSFTIKVDRLRNVWRDALSEYENEKEKLKLFMRENPESVEHQWKELIFGEDFQNDSMTTEAKTLQEFIEIRRTWDSYIIPNEYSSGSTIPSGWIMPNDKPSEKWSLFQFSQ